MCFTVMTNLLAISCFAYIIPTDYGKRRSVCKVNRNIPEALLSIIRNITVTAISVLRLSEMAGLVSGGELGNLVYRDMVIRDTRLILCLL